MNPILFSTTDILKATRLLVFTMVVGLFLSSCEEDISGTEKPKSTSLNKIMPLGASRVEGARPEFESFRYELWKLLISEDWDFDYIGSMTDEARYPDFDSMPFDLDHEGRGGWTTGEILGGIHDWLLKVGTPDIVLFSSPAGNDALNGFPYDQAIANINAIIDDLQTANPNITIIIEQLAPGHSNFMTAIHTDYFNRLQQDILTIAATQTTATSKVVTVDMFTGFNDSLLADEVHYNEAGAKFIADRYHAVLKTILKK